MKASAALWRLTMAAVVATMITVLMANIIRNPTESETRVYVADFTDASGLHRDSDVRVRGVQVGKVESVDLVRRNGQNVAAVRFSLDQTYGIVPASRVAIKFQALTGVRYVDVTGSAEGYMDADLVKDIPTAMTQPSFDVTQLFNGLQPVFATLDPEEVNTFTANVASFLSGDETGLTQLLGSLRKLTDLVSNRQQVIAVLVRNLSTLADELRGKSKQVLFLLDALEGPVDAVLTVLDELRKDFLYGRFFDPVVRLLHSMGLRDGVNLDEAFDRAFSNLDNFFDAFKLVPVINENISPPGEGQTPEPCTRGPAQLPETMDVLLNGTRVVLCHR